jgi:hypothetical protein
MIRLDIAGQTVTIRGREVEASDANLREALQEIAGESPGWEPLLVGEEDLILARIQEEYPDAKILRKTPYRSPRLKPGEVF